MLANNTALTEILTANYYRMSLYISENAKDYNNASAVETKSKRRGRRNKSDDIPLELKENIAGNISK